MTEPVYLSRRERRLAEQGLLPSVPSVDQSSDAAAQDELGAQARTVAQVPAPEVAPLTRRELRAQALNSGLSPAPSEPNSLNAFVEAPVAQQTSVAPEEPVTDSALLFDISPSMSHEPQTNSIVIQNVNELTEISGVISDTGQFLRTGSIELPKLTQTGEIATVLESPAVDAAIHQDGFDSFVSSIAPVRATGVIKSQTKVGIMPIKNRRGQGQYLFALATSFLMLTVGALFVIAYMLGVFDK